MDTTSLVKHADEKSFDTLVLKADKPTLLDFWAPWCGPCKAIGPVLEDIAQAYGEKVNVVKVNVDENPAVAQKYLIRSIPTILLIKDGEVKQTEIGFRSREQLTKLIDKNLG